MQMVYCALLCVAIARSIECKIILILNCFMPVFLVQACPPPKVAEIGN